MLEIDLRDANLAVQKDNDSVYDIYTGLKLDVEQV